jgi:hypothetical protein
MLQPIKSIVVGVISGFCCEADENCTPLGYYAASSGNFLQQREMSEIRKFVMYSDFKKLLLSNILIQELIIRLQY